MHGCTLPPARVPQPFKGHPAGTGTVLYQHNDELAAAIVMHPTRGVHFLRSLGAPEVLNPQSHGNGVCDDAGAYLCAASDRWGASH